MKNSITAKKIESLGFKFLDLDKETKTEYTFEKMAHKSKHYYFLLWKSMTGEVIVSETQIQEISGTFKIQKLYHGKPKTLNELKDILQ